MRFFGSKLFTTTNTLDGPVIFKKNPDIILVQFPKYVFEVLAEMEATIVLQRMLAARRSMWN